MDFLSTTSKYVRPDPEVYRKSNYMYRRNIFNVLFMNYAFGSWYLLIKEKKDFMENFIIGGFSVPLQKQNFRESLTVDKNCSYAINFS
jgi:hypothetical protein